MTAAGSAAEPAARTTTWGLLSTARINSRLLAAARRSDRVAVVAVASRDGARARAYADEHGIERAHGSYDDLLADEGVDAVYVSLPNHLHVTWAERALAGGKHVLCEKPMARDPQAVTHVFDAAERTGRLLTEGFMWRHHPQTRTVERLLRDGAIGRVVEVRCALGFDLLAEAAAAGRVGEDDARLSPEADGGALLDVGTYCTNAIRLFAGEPLRVSATAEVGPTGVDLRTSAVLECAGGAVGRFECSFADPRREELTIVGERGSVRVTTPFLCRAPRIELGGGGESQTIPAALTDAYQLELENLSDAIAGRAELLLGRDDALAQARALDAIARAAASGAPVALDAPADPTHPIDSNHPEASRG